MAPSAVFWLRAKQSGSFNPFLPFQMKIRLTASRKGDCLTWQNESQNLSQESPWLSEHLANKVLSLTTAGTHCPQEDIKENHLEKSKRCGCHIIADYLSLIPPVTKESFGWESNCATLLVFLHRGVSLTVPSHWAMHFCWEGKGEALLWLCYTWHTADGTELLADQWREASPAGLSSACCPPTSVSGASFSRQFNLELDFLDTHTQESICPKGWWEMKTPREPPSS